MTRIKSLSLAAVLVLLPRVLWAWSLNEHRAIALIAQDRLSPSALQAAQEILGAGITLDQISACADAIRGQRGVNCAGLRLDAEPQSQPWHYVNIPISDSPQSSADLASYCSGGDCAVDRIRADLKTLQDPSASRSDKQIALMFLVHFVGDEHQPLHSAVEIVNGVNDMGGNLKSVTWAGGAMADAAALPDEDAAAASSGMGGGLNLHALWDRLIQPADSSDPADLSRRLEDDIKRQDTASWVSGDFIGRAALESFQIAQEQIYPAYRAAGGSTIDSAYQSRMQPVASQRLEKAGVRLAALLEQALNNRAQTSRSARRAGDMRQPRILQEISQPNW